MPIPLPTLDDRRYADLVDEARTLIPNLYPDWTDHNPTDPGITLIELLAWLTETVLYRLDQITEADYRSFLKLLNGPEVDTSGLDLATAIRQTVLTLRERHRAVTPEDYEYLARAGWPRTAEAGALSEPIGRVHCVGQRNLGLTGEARAAAAPHHVSLVVLPDNGSGQPSPALLRGLWRFLDERRLLTVRHHVVGPDYVPVRLTAELYLRDDAASGAVRQAAADRLRAVFHPLSGGVEGAGWPFGRDVYVSEIYHWLDTLAGVDYVEAVRLEAPGQPERTRTVAGEPTGIALDAHELVAIQVAASDFTTFERTGDTWRPIA